MLASADALAVPAAFILALGRIGNFIDGQIVGSLTDAWCAVKFPDTEGFRHPVVLYDGIKNFLLIPILFYFSRRRLPAGALAGLFLFLYAFLRIFIDVFREYPTILLGLATGQSLNILMALLGLLIICLCSRKHVPTDKPADSGDIVITETNIASNSIRLRKFLLGILLLLSLAIPSDWTQDIPSRYGKRHPGLSYSTMYPRIKTSAGQNGPRLKQAPTSRLSSWNEITSIPGKGDAL